MTSGIVNSFFQFLFQPFGAIGMGTALHQQGKKMKKS